MGLIQISNTEYMIVCVQVKGKMVFSVYPKTFLLRTSRVPKSNAFYNGMLWVYEPICAWRIKQSK